VELLDETFSVTVDGSLAVLSVQDTSILVSDSRAQFASALKERVHSNWLVGGRLVNDRCFVSGVVNWDDGVDAVTVNDFLFNDWLGNVVNVVLNVLVNLFAKVDNGALLATVGLSVLVLGSKTSKELAVFIGRRVVFPDFSDWDSVGVVNFIADLFVNDGLDVVLNVVNVSVHVLLAFDFLDFNGSVVNVADVVQVLVVVSNVGSGRVEFGANRVVVTGSVVKVGRARAGAARSSQTRGRRGSIVTSQARAGVGTGVASSGRLRTEHLVVARDFTASQVARVIAVGSGRA